MSRVFCIGEGSKGLDIPKLGRCSAVIFLFLTISSHFNVYSCHSQPFPAIIGCLHWGRFTVSRVFLGE